MTQFQNLTDEDLSTALQQTAEAINTGYKFLKSLDGRQRLGLTLMAESMPGLIEKLETEKRELEAEADRRRNK